MDAATSSKEEVFMSPFIANAAHLHTLSSNFITFLTEKTHSFKVSTATASKWTHSFKVSAATASKWTHSFKVSTATASKWTHSFKVSTATASKWTHSFKVSTATASKWTHSFKVSTATASKWTHSFKVFAIYYNDQHSLASFGKHPPPYYSLQTHYFITKLPKP